MQYYSDKDNYAAANIMFVVFQIFMLLIVYAFVYTSFVAVKLAVDKYDLTVVAYAPEIVSLVLYAIVLYRTRQMFKKEKRLRAVAWVMGWASVIIVLLYAHLSSLLS